MPGKLKARSSNLAFFKQNLDLTKHLNAVNVEIVLDVKGGFEPPFKVLQTPT